MWWIVLEALAALAVLLFLVWWTMFAGRRHGERAGEVADAVDAADTPADDERDGGSGGAGL